LVISDTVEVVRNEERADPLVLLRVRIGSTYKLMMFPST